MSRTMGGTYEREADYATPPGDTLRDTLAALEMSQRELADRTGLSTKLINQIVQGVAPLSHDTALRLEQVTGVPARIWNNLEANYQEQIARLRRDKKLAEQAAWVDELPLAALRKAGVVTKTKRDRVGLLREFVSFFGVADRDAFERVWGSTVAAFRQSPTLKSDPIAVAAWLRKGELSTNDINVAPYDEDAFRAAIRQARRLLNEPPEKSWPQITQAFAAAGVALVLVPEVTGARAFGASRWLTPRKAIIQLSLRQNWEDQFWFSLFHESCHVLKHRKSDVFVSNGDPNDPFEREANKYASRVLIPKRHEAELKSLSTLDEVARFARRIDVPPGVVVGRLQRERILGWHVGNGLRRRFEIVEEPL